MNPEIETKQREMEEAARKERELAFLQWRQDPQTQRFFRFLSEKLAEHQECWSKGVYVSANPDETLQLNHHALGKAEILRDLLELTNEDMEP